jgi:hypothetical protein
MISQDQVDEVRNDKESDECAKIAIDAAASADPDDFPLGLSRRGMLVGGGLLGLLGFGMGSASADASGQIGTASDPLTNLHTQKLNDIQLDIDEGSEGEVLQFGRRGNKLEPGQVEVGSLKVPGGGMVGLEIGTGGLGGTSSNDRPPAIRGGHVTNRTNGRAYGSSILGGGNGNNPNVIEYAEKSSILGGQANKIIGTDEDRANYSSILGGEDNEINSKYSLVCGRGASTDGYDGAFVWGDSTDTTVTATAQDQVRFQAGGGFVVEDNVRTVTGDTTASPGETVIADTSSGEITVTLPSAANGVQITLKCGGSNNLNVLTESNEQIDGYNVNNSSDPYVLVEGGARTLVSDGTNYFEVGKTTGRPDPSA